MNARRFAPFPRLVRFDERGTGLSDPVSLPEIPGLEFGEVGPGAEPSPSDACWAKPDLDAGATTTQMSPGSSGRRARASITATHDATMVAAPFGERFGALTGAGAER